MLHGTHAVLDREVWLRAPMDTYALPATNDTLRFRTGTVVKVEGTVVDAPALSDGAVKRLDVQSLESMESAAEQRTGEAVEGLSDPAAPASGPSPSEYAVVPASVSSSEHPAAPASTKNSSVHTVAILRIAFGSGTQLSHTHPTPNTI